MIIYSDLREMDELLAKNIVNKYMSNEDLANQIIEDKIKCEERVNRKHQEENKKDNSYFSQTGKYKKGR